MDATCAIQNSIHVFSLVHINMCPGFWVHIILISSTGVIDSTGAWGCNHISHFDALVPKDRKHLIQVLRIFLVQKDYTQLVAEFPRNPCE